MFWVWDLSPPPPPPEFGGPNSRGGRCWPRAWRGVRHEGGGAPRGGGAEARHPDAAAGRPGPGRGLPRPAGVPPPLWPHWSPLRRPHLWGHKWRVNGDMPSLIHCRWKLPECPGVVGLNGSARHPVGGGRGEQWTPPTPSPIQPLRCPTPIERQRQGIDAAALDYDGLKRFMASAACSL